jgi:hypothetical protein
MLNLDLNYSAKDIQEHLIVDGSKYLSCIVKYIYSSLEQLNDF